jgi:hypothetical protein
VNKEISSDRYIPNGTPGLYAIPAASNGFSITAGATINVLDIPTNTYKYTFTLDTSVGILNTVPVIGQHLRGKYTDYVSIINRTGSGSGPYVIYTDKEISNLYLFDIILGATKNIKYAYIINDIGWYSYRIFVKQ